MKAFDQSDSKEKTIKDVILSIQESARHLWSRRLLLISLTILGCVFGMLSSLLSEQKYIAKATFIVDEAQNASTLSSFAAIQLPGFSVDNSDGLFTGDNLIWLYTSNRMISETLMKRVDRDKDSILLMNWFIDINKSISEGIEKINEKESYKEIGNEQTVANLTIVQNQILKMAVDIIKNSHLKVDKESPDVGIIGVSFQSIDELFAQRFTQELVNGVNDFYIFTKTRKASEQVEILRKKVGEYNQTVSQSMSQAALAADAVPNANPNLQRLRVAPQRSVVDVQVNSEIYVAMVQQLEAAKVSLAKAEPIIQIIDQPTLPLNVEKKSWIKYFILGGIIGFVIAALILLLKREYNRVMGIR